MDLSELYPFSERFCLEGCVLLLHTQHTHTDTQTHTDTHRHTHTHTMRLKPWQQVQTIASSAKKGKACSVLLLWCPCGVERLEVGGEGLAAGEPVLLLVVVVVGAVGCMTGDSTTAGSPLECKITLLLGELLVRDAFCRFASSALRSQMSKFSLSRKDMRRVRGPAGPPRDEGGSFRHNEVGRKKEGRRPVLLSVSGLPGGEFGLRLWSRGRLGATSGGMMLTSKSLLPDRERTGRSGDATASRASTSLLLLRREVRTGVGSLDSV
jgi:hypothetical protein